MILTCLPVFLLTIFLHSQFDTKEVVKTHAGENAWKYIRESSRRTFARIQQGQDKLIVECSDHKKVTLSLETGIEFNRNELKQEISVGAHRSIANINSVAGSGEKYVYSLEKGNTIKHLMKEKDVSIRVFDSIKSHSFLFTLKKSKKTILAVLNDCGIHES